MLKPTNEQSTCHFTERPTRRRICRSQESQARELTRSALVTGAARFTN